MTGPYYSELLKKLRQAFAENWRGMLTRCPLLQCCCATMHRCTYLQLHEPHSERHRSWTAVSSILLNRHQRPATCTYFDIWRSVLRRWWCQMMSCLDRMPQEFYLTGMKDVFGQYHNVLMWREIVLKN